MPISPRQDSGTRFSTLMSSNSISSPVSLERIKIFLATSIPFKSSRGSGSVYPFAFASFTTSLNFLPSSKELKIKFNVPLKTASMLSTLSPLSNRSFMVLMTGSPAPTFVSYKNFTPRLKAVSFSRL